VIACDRPTQFHRWRLRRPTSVSCCPTAWRTWLVHWLLVSLPSHPARVCTSLQLYSTQAEPEGPSIGITSVWNVRVPSSRCTYKVGVRPPLQKVGDGPRTPWNYACWAYHRNLMCECVTCPQNNCVVFFRAAVIFGSTTTKWFMVVLPLIYFRGTLWKFHIETLPLMLN